MSRITDALKALGTKLNGTAPTGKTVCEVIGSMAGSDFGKGIEMPKPKTGSSDPNTATKADFVGQMYVKTTGDVFVCTIIIGNTYTWKKLTVATS